jgi:hypothetical protein
MMAEPKFTSGPWRVEKSNTYKNTWWVIVGENRLARVGGSPTDTKANAELMADAPRLLEVLRKVLEYSHIDQSWLTLDEAEQSHAEAHELLEKHGG